MKQVYRRLFSLNLALLLVGIAFSGLSAAAYTGTGDIAATSHPARVDHLSHKRSSKARLMGETTEPYYILVGQELFYSNQDASGDTWAYVAEDHALYLENYSGGSIYALGDLNIFTYGLVNISGDYGLSSPPDVGYDGISVDGELYLYIMEGHLYTSGGTGVYQGGDGVYASSTLAVYSQGDAFFTGGQTQASTNGANLCVGGDGICGGVVVLMGGGIRAIGGTCHGGGGGCAVNSPAVEVLAHCALTGGPGYYAGPGVYYGDYCSFGPVDVTVSSGSGTYPEYAICSDSENNWYYSKHTTLTATNTSVVIRVKEYTLTLFGNGGVLDTEATFTNLRAYYPASHDLSQHVFTREGHLQVSWRTTANSLLPLNDLYMPQETTRLYAQWAEVAEGDILLNGLQGAFPDGSGYQVYSGVDVTLPENLTYQEDNSLLGWCDLLSPVFDEDTHLLSGVWFTGGDVIAGDPEVVQQYFAHPRYSGQYAIYHSGEGSLTGGGTILIQGTTSTYSDLQVIIPDGGVMTAPQGYELAGWATSPGGSARYLPGDELQLTIGSIVHLYPVWQLGPVSAVEDGVTFTLDRVKNILTITIPSERACEATAACVYTDAWKALDCAYSTSQGDSDTILTLRVPAGTLPVCKVFFLDSEHGPTDLPITIDLIHLQ